MFLKKGDIIYNKIFTSRVTRSFIAEDAQSVLSSSGLIESWAHSVAVVGTVTSIWTTHTSIDWLADYHGSNKRAVIIPIVIVLGTLLAVGSAHSIGGRWGTLHLSPIDVLLDDFASVVGAVNAEVGVRNVT